MALLNLPSWAGDVISIAADRLAMSLEDSLDNVERDKVQHQLDKHNKGLIADAAMMDRVLKTRAKALAKLPKTSVVEEFEALCEECDVEAPECVTTFKALINAKLNG